MGGHERAAGDRRQAGVGGVRAGEGRRTRADLGDSRPTTDRPVDRERSGAADAGIARERDRAGDRAGKGGGSDQRPSGADSGAGHADRLGDEGGPHVERRAAAHRGVSPRGPERVGIGGHERAGGNLRRAAVGVDTGEDQHAGAVLFQIWICPRRAAEHAAHGGRVRDGIDQDIALLVVRSVAQVDRVPEVNGIVGWVMGSIEREGTTILSHYEVAGTPSQRFGSGQGAEAHHHGIPAGHRSNGGKAAPVRHVDPHLTRTATAWAHQVGTGLHAGVLFIGIG